MSEHLSRQQKRKKSLKLSYYVWANDITQANLKSVSQTIHFSDSTIHKTTYFIGEVDD